MYTSRFTQQLTKGYIAMLSVILIAAIGTVVMMSVVASGVDSGKTNLSLQLSGTARMMATSCVEEALQEIIDTGTTSKRGTLTLGSNSCDYTISTSSGQTILVKATGTAMTVVSKILVIIASTTPSLTLSSWQEVSDF